MGCPLPAAVDLAVVGAGVGGCALVAALRQGGWQGSISLLENGRGPGGRTATRRSRRDAGLRINHGAPLFNIRAQSAPLLLEPLARGGWIEPYGGAIRSLDDQGRLGPALSDGFSDGQLWQGRGGMDQICQGLLALATAEAGSTERHHGCLVRHLQPQAEGWRLLDADQQPLLHCRWLVLSGTLLAHPRCRELLGWSDVPLQTAAAQRSDPQLKAAAAALAALGSNASCNLLLPLPAATAAVWQAQPWRLLQFSAAAQQRWGLRRISLQAHAQQRWMAVAESSADVAARHLLVVGSGSAAEAALLADLQAAVQGATGLPCDSAGAQLMRWGAAFPQPPGLAANLQLCPDSRIGFCGDAIAGPGFGRVEGALNSAAALAQQLLPLL